MKNLEIVRKNLKSVIKNLKKSAKIMNHFLAMEMLKNG